MNRVRHSANSIAHDHTDSVGSNTSVRLGVQYISHVASWSETYIHNQEHTHPHAYTQPHTPLLPTSVPALADWRTNK